MHRDEKITAAVRASLARRMDELIMKEIMGATTTSQSAPEESTLDLAKMLPEWEKIIRNARREQITFVVDLAHDGPMLKHETPCDGARVEMSWRQANELHQHWPLKLHKVNSPEQAEFVPVSGVFPEFVPRILPMPPYDVPQEIEGERT